MDRLTKFAFKLYPRWWRERYGDEFAALLEEARPGLAGTMDVVQGAFVMQLSTFSAKRTLLIGTTGGLMIGLASAYFISPQYSSSAVISMRAPQGPAQVNIANTLDAYAAKALSPERLESLVLRFDLYREERLRMPVKDVLDVMRKNIRITAVPAIFSGRTLPSFGVSFHYPERFMANRIATYVAFGFLDQNIRTPEGSLVPGNVVWEMSQPASLPADPVFPSRRDISLAGVGSGAALGGLFGLIAYVRRLPPARAVPLASQLAAFGPFAACALAGAAIAALTAYVPFTVPATVILEMPNSDAAKQAFSSAIQSSLENQALAETVRKLDLYSTERSKKPLNAVLDRLRQNIRIVPLPSGHLQKRYSIEFRYPKRPGFVPYGVPQIQAEQFTRTVRSTIVKAVPKAFEVNLVTPPPPLTWIYDQFYGVLIAPAILAILGALLTFRSYVQRTRLRQAA